MTPPDDIPLDPKTSQTERPRPPNGSGSHRTISPESEVRGGPEAPEEPIQDPKSHPVRR